jgi:dihydroorotase
MNYDSYLVTNVKLCLGGKLSNNPGYLYVENGKVKAIGDGEISIDGIKVIDGKGYILAPGFVDVHVHFREPGREEKESIHTGSRAAAAGGFTSVVTMPNTLPPVDSAPMVTYQLDRARESGLCRVFPTGAISKGQDGESLTEFGDMVKAGAVGFTDDGVPVMNGGLMKYALQYSKMLGVPVACHAEDTTLAGSGVMHAGSWSTKLGLAGIPRVAEDSMVYRDCELARATGGHLHVAHISTKGAVEIVRQAKAGGVKVTAEATPHHFTLNHSHCKSFSPMFKMNPPLREESDIEAIIEGLCDGTIDCIATDHAPHTAMEKELMFDQAPFGIIGLETSLAVGVTSLVKTGKLSIGKLVQLMTEAPAEIYNLPVGKLKEGTDADFVLFDSEQEWTVLADDVQSRNSNSPWLGEKLIGKVKATFMGGKNTWSDKDFS